MLTGKNDYAPTEKQPNIIMIMNESFADLQSVGDGFKTNKEVLPFFNSLKENTVRGTLQVSVSGGGTACTEYEVLNRQRQRFLPNGRRRFFRRTSTPARRPSSGRCASRAIRPQPFIHIAPAAGTVSAPTPISALKRAPHRRHCAAGNDLDAAWSEAVEAIDPDDGDVLNRLFMSDHYDFKIVREL